MEKRLFALSLMGSLVASASLAQDKVDEIVVESAMTNQTQVNQNDVARILSAKDISQFGHQNFGTTLDSTLGVTSSNYGSAVGQPVIRGLSGNRITVLRNGITVQDVSGLGADHSNDLDMNNVQQIEIIKGPSSLLYKSGSAGGIVNVIDNTIARSDFTERDLSVALDIQAVNDGTTTSGHYHENLGGFNVSLSLADTQFDDYEIPDGADDETGLQSLMNSDYGNTAEQIGISKVGTWGYFGLSLQQNEGTYGIPFHGEEHDDHADEGHSEEAELLEDDDHHDEHGEERILAVVDSETVTLEGSYNVNGGWLNSIDYHYRGSDYALTEGHAGEPDDSTRFENDADEFGVLFKSENDAGAQTILLNHVTQDISVAGAEVYMAPSESEETALGYYISRSLGGLSLDAAIRYDHVTRDGSIDDEGDVTFYDIDYNNVSYAVSFGNLSDGPVGVTLSLAHAERAPSVSELFMHGVHLSTGRFEVGNIDLKSEESNNIEVAFNYEENGSFMKTNVFFNDVDNYIYLQDETDDDHGDHGDEHGDYILAEYLQRDARLYGYEFEVGKNLDFYRGTLRLSLGRDEIIGEFSNGADIPRMPPARNVVSASYLESDLEVSLVVKNVSKQSRIGETEIPTPGYDAIDVSMTKSFALSGDRALDVSIYGNNLLDEVVRNHTSSVKDHVPLPGRNIGLRVQMDF